MYVVHAGIVTGVKSTALSVATTCFQYHGYGRRTGLKIRSSQEGVGSSPTFDTDSARGVSCRLVARNSSNFRDAVLRMGRGVEVPVGVTRCGRPLTPILHDHREGILPAAPGRRSTPWCAYLASMPGCCRPRRCYSRPSRRRDPSHLPPELILARIRVVTCVAGGADAEELDDHGRRAGLGRAAQCRRQAAHRPVR
jgi:hypothetical protein